MKRVSEERAGGELVDTFVDSNLGIFGLLRPPQFIGIAASKNVSEALRAVLGEFSFPALNVVFSAASRLLEKKGQRLLKEASGLKLMEMRLVLEPQDKQGKPIELDPFTPVLKILALNPSETKAVKTVDGQVVQSGGPAPSPRPKIQPDISAIVSALVAAAGAAGAGAAGAGAAAAGPAGIIAAAAPVAANLALDFFSSDEEPDIRFPILEKATIASHNEFAWFLRSQDVEQKEGTHYGTAFLQVNRKVHQLKVTALLSSDWKRGLQNQLDEFETTLVVNHPAVPKTPNITDFTQPSNLPLVVPRSDVKTLLGISNAELDELINLERLQAFGSERNHISKGSLTKLLGV